MTMLECVALWSTCFAIGFTIGLVDCRIRRA